MEQITLYKERSYAACISEGFKFLAQHLRMIVKILLPYFFISTLLSAIHNGFTQASWQLFMITGDISVADMIVIFITFTTAYFAAVFSVARMYLMFRRVLGTETSNSDNGSKTRLAAWKATLRRTLQLTRRTLPYSIWPYVISIIFFLFLANAFKWMLYMLSAGNVQAAAPAANEQTNWTWIVFLCIMFILFVAFVFFTLPLTYTFDHHMMKPDLPPGSSFRTQYRNGMKHLGKIFGLNTISGFMLITASVIFALPDIVLSQAYQSSVTSQLSFGDPAEIPSYAYVVMLIVSAIASSFIYILSIAFHISHVLLYGDIYTKSNQ